jgi:hypothetical protein
VQNYVSILDGLEESVQLLKHQRVIRIYCKERLLVEGSTLLKAFLESKRSGELKDPNDETMYNPLVTRNRKDLKLLYNDKIL